MAEAVSKGVVLLGMWMSPFGQRCLIALKEKGVGFEYKEEDLGNKSPLLLKSNPVHKTIPVLLHDGKPVCESLIIVQYIDEVWSGGPSLLPADPYARAQARFWADFVDKKIYECSGKMFKSKGQALEEAKKEFTEVVKLLEGELDDKKFFGGDSLGFVDIALLPFTSWFYTYEARAGLSVQEVAPKLVAWGNRSSERESVASTLTDPHKVYHKICEVVKHVHGVE